MISKLIKRQNRKIEVMRATGESEVTTLIDLTGILLEDGIKISEIKRINEAMMDKAVEVAFIGGTGNLMWAE